MELPNIGQQCSEIGCRQLDFLPFNCECNKKFCSEHFKLHIEKCSCYRNNSQSDLRKIENVYRCEKDNCQETSIVPLICERCNRHFCIKHRHITSCEDVDPNKVAAEKEKYAAPVREFNKAKNLVDQQVENTLTKARLKGKKEMANKVQLMKIKNKATGLKSIPTTDRIYFSIEYLDKSNPVFVSRNWSVGRAIDAIADELKLKNNNNKSGEKKLRLFKKDTRLIISKDMSEMLGNLIESNIVDGDNLIIDYVEDHCEKI